MININNIWVIFYNNTELKYNIFRNVEIIDEYLYHLKQIW